MIIRQNLLSLKNELENQKKLGSWGTIQKAFSSPHFILLRVRRPGSSYFIYLGRGGNFQGIHFGDQNVDSSLRVIDSYLEYIRKNLVGVQVKDIVADENDRIVHIIYQNIKIKGIFSLFWKGSHLYFMNTSSLEKVTKIFRSWIKGVVQSNEDNEFVWLNNHLNEFDGLGRKVLSKKGKKITHFELSKYIEFCNQTFNTINSNKKEIKKIDMKIFKIEQDLIRVCAWERLRDYIETVNLENVRVLKFEKIKIDLTRISGHYKKRERVFEKIKSFKKAQSFLQQRLEDAKTIRLSKTQEVGNLDFSSIKILNPLIQNKGREQVATKINSNNEFYEYKYLKNCQRFYIGRTAQGNDFIRKTFASKNNWWVHLDGYTSSHCIIKSDERPNIDFIKTIASILRDFSALDIEQVPVLLCQVKNLKGVTGVPGKVIFKNEKRLAVVYDKMWNNLVDKKEV